MLNYIKRKVAEYNREKIDSDKLVGDLYNYFQRAYITGIRVQDDIKKYGAVCETCGNYLFPVRDDNRMRGITVQIGKCERCGNTGTLIPIRDFMYSAGYPGVLWD